MKNEKLQAIVKAMENSHPNYMGEDYHMSIQHDSEEYFYVKLFAPDSHKEFFTSYALETVLCLDRLYGVNVAVRSEQGLPIITISGN